MEDLPLFLVGFILIAAGFLAGRFPGLLMRYNSFPKRKEDDVDWAGAGKLARKYMAIGGLCQLAGTVTFVKLGLKEAVIVLDVLIVMTVVILFIAKSRKYNL
ncbi:protein of unknown function [Parabacteroides chinchillae]|uniref:Uncharacterized protein n=2 Tax=Tannerellaceae TaxID=2005525 RepID=A0A8G2BYT1_9BACT|nr:protein of unknown function [Parabacteroides chinchillae]